jgi:superfamily I DNA/RNA helicase
VAAAKHGHDERVAVEAVIRAFFEGPAGSGKTHQLIEEAVTASREVLLHPEQKLLALTFMNGARHRLNFRFGEKRELRGRFACLTFDSFAGTVARRRRALSRSLPPVRHGRDTNDFDRTCIEAARLLELPEVANWVANSYPLVVVDEAQDLDAHRLRLLKALSEACCVVAAADEFQNLNDHVDSGSVVTWLRMANRPHALTRIRRTAQDGLLRAAGALRSGTGMCHELAFEDGFQPCHAGDGIRVVSPPAKNSGALSWAVANELSALGNYAVILTPDAKGKTIQQVLASVQTKAFNRNKRAGTTFGPFPLVWERREEDDAAEWLARFDGDGTLKLRDVVDTVSGAQRPECRYICERLERARNIRGETTVTRERLTQVIRDVLRDAGRALPPSGPGRRVMTIPRAKNREFGSVLVLWPHSVAGSPEHQRRLLYNAITRAKDRCSVVVFGQGRTDKAPFS